MKRESLIAALDAYRRPGTPVDAYHFRNLSADVRAKGNAATLRDILADESLSPRVREHAAGALGEVRDKRAVTLLISALDSAKLRRGAAIALGLIGDDRAVPALKVEAERCKAARWALSQFDREQSTDALLNDLSEGHLRDIAKKLRRVPPKQRRAVSDEALRRLRAVVESGRLGQEHRWLMTALQSAEGAEVDAALANALQLTVDNRDICPTVRGRLLRIISGRRAATAIPALVNVACQTDSPSQAHMATACLNKMLRAHGEDALSAKSRTRLAEQRELLTRLRTTTSPKAPPRPWVQTPGSPRWFDAIDRAIKGIDRLVA